MAIVHKLVIIRAKKATDAVVAEFKAKFGHLVNADVAQPVAVLPVVWSDQQDPSHVGFVLSKLMLADVRSLEAWDRVIGHATVYDLKDTSDASIEAALNHNGLRIHPLVDRTQGT